MYAIRSYYGDKANEIRETARRSIGTYLPAKSLELKHTIKLRRELTAEINENQTEIKKIMDAIDRITSYNVCYTKLLRTTC